MTESGRAARSARPERVNADMRENISGTFSAVLLIYGEKRWRYSGCIISAGRKNCHIKRRIVTSGENHTAYVIFCKRTEILRKG